MCREKLLFLVTAILTAHQTVAVPTCTNCAPGYFKSGHKCEPCPDSSFTSSCNSEQSCHSCFKDCREEYNMEVVANCTKTSNVKCRCKEGFTCKSQDRFNNLCRECVRITTTAPHTQSAGHYSTTASCKPNSYRNTTSGRCETHTDCDALGQEILIRGNATHNTICKPVRKLPPDQNAVGRVDDNAGGIAPVMVILIGVILPILTVTLIIIICLRICKAREEICFKKLVKQCSFRHPKGENGKAHIGEQIHAQEVGSHELPSANHSANCCTHQPTSLGQPPTEKLGPLHIYGARTVFVSLMNQFGLGGGGGGGGGGDKEEDVFRDRDPAESIPPSSPVPLSQEERDEEKDFMFFPSQEQGKESHMSKEEGL